MKWRSKKVAATALGLGLLFLPVANRPQLPGSPRSALAQDFNSRANPDAPVYNPQIWNDGSDDKVTAFYASHQKELGKIAKKDGRQYMWVLAQMLHKTNDKQLHDRYGLTLKQAKEFRAAFGEMTAGMQFRNNCYSYAIGHPDNPPGWKLSPGEAAGLGVAKPNEFDKDDLLRRVKADGLLVAGDNPEPKPGYYLIAMFVIPGEDFHFVRQNNDGTWSQKTGDEQVSNLDFSDNPILDPRKADLGKYEFVSYLYAPKGGLKFAPKIQPNFRK